MKKNAVIGLVPCKHRETYIKVKCKLVPVLK
jgi:hypothetical protein